MYMDASRRDARTGVMGRRVFGFKLRFTVRNRKSKQDYLLRMNEEKRKNGRG
jgi:hypothetical protein